MNNDLITLSVELAKAHLAQNRMSHHDVPAFVRSIHEVLSELENKRAVAESGGAPAAMRARVSQHSIGEALATAQVDTGRTVSPSATDVSRVAPILHDDPSNPAFAGLDPWLATRISPKMASKLDPANSIHPTVFPDYIVCLEDGEKVKLLRPYVQKRFGLAFNEYLDKWNLPDDYPTAPPKYLEAKRAAAKASGLGVTTRAHREKSRMGASSANKTGSAKAGGAGKAEPLRRGARGRDRTPA